ncbi:MAG: FAD-binding protein [Spongiibacteraceae bacterium]
MERQMPEEIDVLVVGSGAAAIAGAITAARAGLSALIIEKTDCWGGTSALSGGGVWIPNNIFMRENGIDDTADIALQYLDEIVENVGACTSPARKQAFVKYGPEMVEFLRENGFEWSFSTHFPDYYPNKKGVRSGRALGARVMDGNNLGAWQHTLRKSQSFPPLVFNSSDVFALISPLRTVGNFLTLLRILAVSIGWRLSGRRPLSMGSALVGRLLLIAQKLNIPLFLNTPLVDLREENGRIVSADIHHDENIKRVRINKAVLLAAGGFARNDQFRRQYQPVGGDYSAAPPGDTGDAIQIGQKLGAATALMDEAWWQPNVVMPDGSVNITLWERAMPHSIMVDQRGERYMNEAQPYVDCGRHMLARDRITPAIPSWLIMDARHRKQYVFVTNPPGVTPKKLIDAGFFIKADSLDDLALQCGIDARKLHRTVSHFNLMARKGVDDDFNRGDNAFDNSYGDPLVQPNPNLGPIEQAPFWAVRIYPGDIGTKGGLLTDENAQVVRDDGTPIGGLYAAGNSSASVMGRSYPGAGGTLGPALTFAYIAMRHAAT